MQNGRYVRLIVEREGALRAFASVPERHMRGTIDPRRGGWVRQADPSSGALAGIAMTGVEAPCLAALVWT